MCVYNAHTCVYLLLLNITNIFILEADLILVHDIRNYPAITFDINDGLTLELFN